MAVTTNAAVIVKTPLEGDEFFVSTYSADLAGAEDLIAAVSGKSLYINKIQVFAGSVADSTITFGAGQGTGVTTIYLGPIPVADAGGEFLIDFGPDHSMKIASATAFSVDVTGTTVPFTILIWGKTAS